MTVRRRELLSLAAAWALAGCASFPPAARGLRRIALGSCIDQKRPQPIWDAIMAEEPDLFLFGGDNVYAETPYTRERLRHAYAQAAASEGMNRLRSMVPHLAIWDDHDYGPNDGGAEFAHKQEAKEEFLAFWKVPADDPRRTREALYHVQVFGPPGRRVQVILLDARWFRSSWKPTDQRGAPGRERYVPDADPGKTLLGEAQWRWLEAQLRQPAELRFIVSGIQVLAEGHGWERWGNFPLERQRLFGLIGTARATGVVLLSGDRHIGALYREAAGVPYPLYEMTSSGMTHPWTDAAEPGPNRLGELYTGLHFGTVEIDWSARRLALQLKDVSGAVQREQQISFSELQVHP